MDDATLTKLFTADGPFVSIYLDTTSAVEDAAQRLELRWKNVLRELDHLGVDEATRDALTEARGSHGPGNTRVLVASHGQVHLATWLPHPPPADLVRVEALPHLLPLLDHLALQVPHVVVLADREGADVLAYRRGGRPAEEATHDAHLWPIHHTGSADWSSKHHDNKVRNSWEESAKETADLVDRVAADVDAQVVVASGDPRALALIAEALPERRRAAWQVVDGGGRHVDGSDEVVARGVLDALAHHVARATLDLLEEFAGQRDRAERAADGVDDTVQALRRAQVGTLVLTDAFDDADAAAFFGPDATQLARRPDELSALGVQQPQQARLVDVLVRAALGTGAEVRVVTGGVEQAPRCGVGALLRYSEG